MKPHWLIALIAAALAAAAGRADGPSDNVPEKVRPVPPPGVEIPAADRTELEAGVADLGKEIDDLRAALKDKLALLDLLPDVQIYHNAVRYALSYNEFYGDAAKQVATAKAFLKQGHERAQALRDGKAPWTTATGLIARGYVSRIDGSVQPYGILVPASFKPDAPDKHRLDLWAHGRGENLTELNFIDSCQKGNPDFVPEGAFVLRLYGRYCCANKFAGEIDAFEAMDSAKKHYPIDDNRIAIRGFSMGGAAAWHLAVHYPSVWAAAAPGAGFSETADFLKVFQNEPVQPTWYEQKLYHMYDATDYAGNLFNCPTVAYSGEDDSQKQAADVMADAARREKLSFIYLIGYKTKHAYEPETKKVLAREIDGIVAKGRDEVPAEVRFTTYTLRYNRDAWVTVDGLEKHWERADVKGTLNGADIVVNTKNVSALTLSLPPIAMQPTVTIDGMAAAVRVSKRDVAWTAHYQKNVDGKWALVNSADDGTLAKRHGLQGPIDDAFMDSFLMVKPTGKALNDKVGAWAATEMKHAVEHWRKQFRGEAPVKDDAEISDADIASHNLILWGDPSSNKVLAKIADKLPIRWDGDKVVVGADSYPSSSSMPVLIYPNPLNPKRYVVLNSGFTFREYDYLNNARQISKLPDYAVIDVNTPPSSRLPGAVATAGFFDEHWKLQANGGQARAGDDNPWVVYNSPNGDGPGKGKHIVFVSGDEEYRSEEGLPQLAKILSQHYGFKCTVLFAIDPKDGTINPNVNNNIPGLEALKTADLMVILTRWRDLPDDQMKYVVDYVESGKPVVGLRTATHAFKFTTSKTYAKYSDGSGDKDYPGGFGKQVLGEQWVNHWGSHMHQSTGGVIVKGQEDNPILRGIKDRDVWGPTDVYEVHLPLRDSCTPLVLGAVLEGMKPDDKPIEGKKNDPMMPVAWTNSYKSASGKTSRVFATTMGASTDLEREGTRRMVVNACFWALGMEDKIPAKGTDVELVGEYKPHPYKGDGFQKGVKPADLQIK